MTKWPGRCTRPQRVSCRHFAPGNSPGVALSAGRARPGAEMMLLVFTADHWTTPSPAHLCKTADDRTPCFVVSYHLRLSAVTAQMRRCVSALPSFGATEADTPHFRSVYFVSRSARISSVGFQCHRNCQTAPPRRGQHFFPAITIQHVVGVFRRP